MRVEMSVTRSEEILQDLERVARKGRSRSAIIERALRDYISKRAEKLSDAADLKILNTSFRLLNSEAVGVLTYQTAQPVDP
jgi:metal-responsive CopG/Arc/MetJ family transcriptional regulator